MIFKRIFFSFLLGIFLLSSIPFSYAERSFPDPTGYVNDFANILSPKSESDLNALATEIKTSSDAEIAIVTVDTLDGYEPNYYAVELGRAWGVGTKRDDGIIFITSVQDKKTYIATGYGVESFITDAQAFWITEQIVLPYFREGNYDEGILAGVRKIKEALVDLTPLPEKSSSNGKSSFPIIFIITFVFPWVSAVLARSKRWWPGGVVGAVIGLVLIFVFEVSFWFIVPLILFGFIFDYLASNNYKNGIDKWWTGGGGGGWGGGIGGNSSGGFGGFSGGSFGGGGGGSSW